MQTSQIRQRWLDYFENKGHTVVPSASLISPDPTLLFTVAGMVPFIPYLTGQQTAPYPRATSVQKCVRTLDIDEVGKTTRHGTFFQMNGNFSFGDYFKERAIEYAWELITSSQDDGGYGFNPDDIWVTVYEDDDEAETLWRTIAGLPTKRIQRRGKADNYWHTGVPGPGGPCSEIYVDRGPEYGAEGGPVVDEDRYLEIWNLVFMQHELSDVRAKTDFDIAGPLPRQNIDTGMGLERVAYLLQGKDNLYEIDEVFPVVEKAAALAGVTYGADSENDVRLRVVADHVRSSLMLIGDGVAPSNEGRGYILRRLMRRSVRAMRLMGVDSACMLELMTTSKDKMSLSYPELERGFERISTIVVAEEEAFARTLAAGTSIFDTAVNQAKAADQKVLPGSSAFTLHDTYGFPIDLTLEMAAERGLNVDQEGFRTLMTEQRERAKADARAKKTGRADLGAYKEIADSLVNTVDFVGYSHTVADGTIKAVLVDGQARTASEGDDIELVLDRTPFYAEGGGQLADNGVVELSNGAHIRVDDVQTPIPGLIVHKAKVISGEVTAGAEVNARVDVSRRKAISRAHTATHMVHKAIREALGDTATQAGSENAPGRFRFDFNSAQAVPDSVLADVEARVNDVLIDDLEVYAEEMTQAEAIEFGAMALFGEKYGDTVRVISVGDWAKELCGGTHAQRSGQLGVIKLLSESSIGSGIRRVEALVGADAYQFMAREHALVGQLSMMMKARPDELVDRVSGVLDQLKEAEKDLAKVRADQVLAAAANLAAGADDVNGVAVVAHQAPNGTQVPDLRSLVQDIRKRLGDDRPSVVAATTVNNDRPVIIVATNERARQRGIKAGALVKVAAGVLGGGGGGKDDMAQGGGQDSSQIADALRAVIHVVAGA